jgi:hypothetical protein
MSDTVARRQIPGILTAGAQAWRRLAYWDISPVQFYTWRNDVRIYDH